MLLTERDRLKGEIEALAAKYDNDRTGLLPILQEVQRRHHHVSSFAMQVIADLLKIHPVEVHSVVSFYSFLHVKPRGNFIVRVCRTISCDMQNKTAVARQLESDLGITFGQTTPDNMFSLEWAECLGMCDQGPALLVNEKVFVKVTPERVKDILDECRSIFGEHSTERNVSHL